MTDGTYGQQAPGYGTPPGTGPQTATRHGSGMATTALVLGIIALVLSITVIGGIVLGILAIVFGIIGVRRGRQGAPGGGRAIAGIVTGVLGLLISVGLIAFGVSILNSPSVKNLQSCVQDANGDQAAIQQCDQQFQNSN